MWKEASLAQFEALTRNFSGVTAKKQKFQSGRSGVPAEILNGHPTEYKSEAKFSQVASLILQNIYKYLKRAYQIF